MYLFNFFYRQLFYLFKFSRSAADLGVNFVIQDHIQSRHQKNGNWHSEITQRLSHAWTEKRGTSELFEEVCDDEAATCEDQTQQSCVGRRR